MRNLSWFLFALNLCLGICCIILYIKYSSVYIETEKPLLEICYDSTENDALQSAEDPSFSPGKRGIFFHETSCLGWINSRKACAIESAARLHPERKINLLFTSSVTKSMLLNDSLRKLSEFQNVQFARIHLTEYSKDTVIATVLSQYYRFSSYLTEHAADILRILTLHKFGGISLDTDVILIKSLQLLPANWVMKETNVDITTCAMAFAKDTTGEAATTAILLEQYATFNPKFWSYNGPRAIQTVIYRICPKEVERNDKCIGVKILDQYYIYQISSSEIKRYFMPGLLDEFEEPHMYHLWNSLTHNITVKKHTAYDYIGQLYCPKIYETFGEKFGT